MCSGGTKVAVRLQCTHGAQHVPPPCTQQTASRAARQATGWLADGCCGLLLGPHQSLHLLGECVDLLIQVEVAPAQVASCAGRPPPRTCQLPPSGAHAHLQHLNQLASAVRGAVGRRGWLGLVWLWHCTARCMASLCRGCAEPGDRWSDRSIHIHSIFTQHTTTLPHSPSKAKAPHANQKHPAG